MAELRHQTDDEKIAQWHFLYEKCYEAVHRTMYRYVKNPEVALELTQEVYLKAWKSRANAENVCWKWLTYVIRSVALDWFARQKSKPAYIYSLDWEYDSDEGDDRENFALQEDPCSQDAFDQIADHEELTRILRVLRPDYARVMWAWAASSSYEEGQRMVADICPTLGSYKEKVSRGKKLLRQATDSGYISKPRGRNAPRLREEAAA